MVYTDPKVHRELPRGERCSNCFSLRGTSHHIANPLCPETSSRGQAHEFLWMCLMCLSYFLACLCPNKLFRVLATSCSSGLISHMAFDEEEQCYILGDMLTVKTSVRRLCHRAGDLLTARGKTVKVCCCPWRGKTNSCSSSLQIGVEKNSARQISVCQILGDMLTCSSK